MNNYRSLNPEEVRIDVLSKTFVKATHVPSGIACTKYWFSGQHYALDNAIDGLESLVKTWNNRKEMDNV